MDKQVRGVIATVCSPLSGRYGAIEMNVIIIIMKAYRSISSVQIGR